MSRKDPAMSHELGIGPWDVLTFFLVLFIIFGRYLPRLVRELFFPRRYF
jgi:hypothetical protein